MASRGWEAVTPEQLAALNPRALVRVPTTPQPRGRSNDLADALYEQIRLASLPLPVREFRFHPVRRWRWDLAWVDRLIAFECNGAEFSSGRHNRGLGMAKDFEKHNTATLAGWTVFYGTGTQVRSGYALTTIETALTS